MKNKLVALPYIIWMFLFIIAPLIIVVFYAFSDGNGGFTLSNIVSLKEFFRLSEIGKMCAEHKSAHICLKGDLHEVFLAAFQNELIFERVFRKRCLYICDLFSVDRDASLFDRASAFRP